MPETKPITLAVIIGAHGVMGEVRLKLFADGVESVKAHSSFNDGKLTLKNIRAGNNIIARFAEITDRNAAEAARGIELTIPRDLLPPLAEGEYYHTDIIGLTCVSVGGEALGTCIAIENFGAGDVIEIERPTTKRFMVPVSAVEFVGELIRVEDIFAGE